MSRGKAEQIKAQRTALALIELCHGGEFAAWMATRPPGAPMAAMREYADACDLVRDLLKGDERERRRAVRR